MCCNIVCSILCNVSLKTNYLIHFLNLNNEIKKILILHFTLIVQIMSA